MWWLLGLTAANIHTQTQTVTLSTTQKHHICQHTHIMQHWFDCLWPSSDLAGIVEDVGWGWADMKDVSWLHFALSYCINWTYNNFWSCQWIKNHKQSRVIKNVPCMTLLYISVYSVIWIDHCMWCLVAILQEFFQHLMNDGMNPFMCYRAVILYLLHSDRSAIMVAYLLHCIWQLLYLKINGWHFLSVCQS